jgi:prenyltransferase beta subunit
MQSKIDLARTRAEQYLLSLQVRPGVFDFSAYNGGREAGMLLPGTYNAVNALGLMKRLDASWMDDSIAFLQSFRNRGGFLRMPGMKKS